MLLSEMAYKESNSPTWEDVSLGAGELRGPRASSKGVLTAEDLPQGARARLRRRRGLQPTAAVSWRARPATIDALPEIVAAVGDQMEVLMDGGCPSRKRRDQGARPGRQGGADRPSLRVGGSRLGGQDGVAHMLELFPRRDEALECSSWAASRSTTWITAWLMHSGEHADRRRRSADRRSLVTRTREVQEASGPRTAGPLRLSGPGGERAVRDQGRVTPVGRTGPTTLSARGRRRR